MGKQMEFEIYTNEIFDDKIRGFWLLLPDEKGGVYLELEPEVAFCKCILKHSNVRMFDRLEKQEFLEILLRVGVDKVLAAIRKYKEIGDYAW